MTIDDIDTPDSDGWWLQRLMMELHDRRVGRCGKRRWTRSAVKSSRVRPPLLILDDYLRGDPPLQEGIHTTWAAEFRVHARMGRLNIADLLVSAPSNRMGIRDFRTSAGDDDLGDAKARQLMRANKLKLVARDVHDYMLGLGDGYTIVTPPDSTRKFSLITGESPLQCITAEDPATGQRLAGLKVFRDDYDTTDWAYLFRPGVLRVAKLEGPTSIRELGPARTLAKAWDWVDEKSDDVPGNKVAMVRFRNRRGVGEFERHLDTLDRINDKLFNEWWIGKIQAFRQRAVMLDDEDSEELDDALAEEQHAAGPDASHPAYSNDPDVLAGIFTSAPDALWRLPLGAKMWESTPVDTGPMIVSISKELERLSAATSNPLHTITPDAANGSAEGASLMREEHVYKIEDRRDRAEGGWAETLGMAFEFQGDTERADVTGIEPLWVPIERYSLQEKTTAAAAVKGILPVEAIEEDILQYAPADVQDRLRSMRAREVLFLPPAPAAAPVEPAPAPPAPQPPAGA